LTQNGKYLQLTLFNGETHQTNKADKERRESYVVVSFKKHIIYIPNVDSRLQRTERNYRGDREKSAQALLADIGTFREERKSSVNMFNKTIDNIIRPGVVFDSILDSENNQTIIVSPEIDSLNTFTQWYDRLKEKSTAVVTEFTQKQRFVKKSRQKIKRQDIKISQYLVEVHKKFSTSFACIVFVFIGVPLGIMARQGSMAVSVSYSIFFFVLYWIFLIGGERLADNLVISPALAMWSCNVIIGSFGIILIIRMVRESTFINYGPIIKLLRKIFGSRKKKTYSKLVKETPVDIIFQIPKLALNKVVGILPSYLIRKFISNLIAVFGALVIIFVVIDYVSNLRLFDRAYFPDILLYYWYYLAWFLQLIFPIGILLASMFSMTSLAIHSELTAIKAAGMSIHRLTFAILFLGLLLSVFNFILGEKIIPYANLKKKEVYDCMRSGKKYYKNEAVASRSRNFYRDFYYFGNKNTAYHFDEINVSNKQARVVRRDKFKSNKIVENISAEYLTYTSGDKWLFINGEKKSFQNGIYKSVKFDTLPDAIIDVSPQEMVVPIKSIENMSYWELKDLLEKVKKRGENVFVYQADLHFKIALSFLSFIVMLLGLSVTARVGRKGGTASFGIGLLLVFSFWILSQLILALGKNGTIDPVLAAWAGNILYLVIGLFLYRRASQ
jgi:LPS export ABC transporter permease LptG